MQIVQANPAAAAMTTLSTATVDNHQSGTLYLTKNSKYENKKSFFRPLIQWFSSKSIEAQYFRKCLFQYTIFQIKNHAKYVLLKVLSANKFV